MIIEMVNVANSSDFQKLEVPVAIDMLNIKAAITSALKL